MLAEKPEEPGASGSGDTEVIDFYGIPVHSDHIVFILDVSGSMAEPAEWTPEPEEDDMIETGGRIKGGGAPNRGQYTEPDEILRELAKINKFRKLVIHTIGVGQGQVEYFLRSLAEQNGGKYVRR